MSISISEQYPGKTAGNTTDYPFGQAQNVSAPGDGTGTPWEQAIVNDDQGFKQALLLAAGLIPSGTPDTALDSQYLEALKKLFPLLSGFGNTETDSTTGEIRIPLSGKTLRIKYGRTGFVGSYNTLHTQNFVAAFPSKCLFVIPYTVTNVTTGEGAQNMVQLVGEPTRTAFQWFSDRLESSSSPIACGYVAVGY